ncbi:MAG: YoaK family protein, partial [bacterium]|nr:YoaK family protein [bacterium]
CRGHVFANAQTGNIVLLGKYIAERNIEKIPHYLVPILAFIGGVILAQRIRFLYGKSIKVHWRQLVLLIEIGLLFAAAWLPNEENWNVIANALVSFSCAMQVDSFRKVRGNALATTMCIGNLRTATDLLCAYWNTKDGEIRRKSVQYYTFIVIFAGGAVLGNAAVQIQGKYALWWCCAALILACLLMLIQEEKNSSGTAEKEGLWEELEDIATELKRKIGSKKRPSGRGH